jgi:regulator of chromosome condensation
MIDIYGYGSGEIDQLGLGDEIFEAKKPVKVLPNDIYPQIKVSNIICGCMHTIVLSSMGKLYSWGCNDDFALGRTGIDNEPIEVILPVPVNGIAAGDSHSVAYNTDLNKVFLWGSYRNSDGKFGEQKEKPVLLDSKKWKSNVDKVVCGANHTMFLANKKVYLWGNAEFGQIGR